MKYRLSILMFLMGLALVAPARGEDTKSPALSAFLARSMAQGVSPNFVQEVLREAQRLEAQGIPAEPYLLKANEGLAKGIPPSKMQGALRQTRRRSETAAGLVDHSLVGVFQKISPQEKRNTILQFQAALLNGSSPADLEKRIKKLEKTGGGKVSLRELSDEVRALQPRRHVALPVKAISQPESHELKAVPLSKEKGHLPKQSREKTFKNDVISHKPKGPHAHPHLDKSAPHGPKRKGKGN